MKTVRERILDYISSHRAATASEISHSFRMSNANARYHLKILMEQGAIQIYDHRHSSLRGRRERVYAVAESISGNNLEILADVLLSFSSTDATDHTDGNPLSTIGIEMARRMVRGKSQYSEPHSHPNTLTYSLNLLVEILNKYHYVSRWEARTDSPRIVLGRCPYRTVLNHHPEICTIDEHLISQLLGSEVELTIKQAIDPSGLTYCVLRIKRERV